MNKITGKTVVNKTSESDPRRYQVTFLFPNIYRFASFTYEHCHSFTMTGFMCFVDKIESGAIITCKPI